MARVLICEPDPEVRELLGHVVSRLGHEPVFDGEADETLDVLVLEPADPVALERIRLARQRRPDLPVICASIDHASEESSALAPVAHLLKPFSLPDLERTLREAFAIRC